MNSIEDVREQLSLVFKDLRAGLIKHKDAAELNNSAGKIISSLKVELDYYALRKEKPNIKFLSTDKT
jgi:hypothetical protein